MCVDTVGREITRHVEALYSEVTYLRRWCHGAMRNAMKPHTLGSRGANWRCRARDPFPLVPTTAVIVDRKKETGHDRTQKHKDSLDVGAM